MNVSDDNDMVPMDVYEPSPPAAVAQSPTGTAVLAPVKISIGPSLGGGGNCIISEESCYSLLLNQRYYAPIEDVSLTLEEQQQKGIRVSAFVDMIKCFASISGVTNCWSRVTKNAFVAAMMAQGFSAIIADAAFSLLAQYEHIDQEAIWKHSTRSMAYPTSIFGPSAAKPPSTSTSTKDGAPVLSLSFLRFAVILAILKYYDLSIDNTLDYQKLRLQIIFQIYDEDNDRTLDYSEFRAMIRDMSAGELHVNGIMEALGITPETSVDLDTFVQPATFTSFSRFLLRTRDLLSFSSSSSSSQEANSSKGGATGGGGGGGAGVSQQDHRISMEAIASMHARAFLDLSVSAAKFVVNPPPPPSSSSSSNTGSTSGGESVNQLKRLFAARCASAPMSHTVLPWTRRKDEMFSDSDWRGLLVDRQSQGFQVALRVITNTKALILSTYTESFDMLDCDWMTSSKTGASEAMFGVRAFTKENFGTYLDMIRALCQEAKRIVKAQPMVISCAAPCKVFGDIHGQLRDLLLLFREYCFPCSAGGDIESVTYVFDGDFVDRGCHQVEVMILLLALKVAFPARVFLLRGNHETRSQNESQGACGFLQACLDHFSAFSVSATATSTNSAATANGGDSGVPSEIPIGKIMYDCFHEVFDYLPFAALIENRILVVHGGIGKGDWTLDDLRQISRPIRDEHILSNDMLYQILWSDPDAADDEMQRGVHPNPRGGPVVTFTTEITEGFCYRNGLTHIIRGHQYVPEGARIMHNGKLITIFSARNYLSKVKNDGALLLICKDEERNVRLKVKLLKQIEFC